MCEMHVMIDIRVSDESDSNDLNGPAADGDVTDATQQEMSSLLDSNAGDVSDARPCGIHTQFVYVSTIIICKTNIICIVLLNLQ